MSPPLALADLHGGDYDTVIVAAPDMAGRLVGKRLAPAKLEQLAEPGIGVSSCVVGWALPQEIGLDVPYTGWHTGWRDFLLVPDLATLRPAAWLERTAIVLADCIEEETGAPVEIVPRTILRRQLEALRADGLAAYAGTEPEFHLYRDTYDDLRRRGYRELRPSTLVHSDYTIQQPNAWEPFFQRVRGALDASGLDVDLSQGEWGLGQWEINLAYGDALDMCDRHAIFKLALRDLAASAGLAATFMAKPVADGVGSSCHVHLSLRGEDGTRPFFDEREPHGASTTLSRAIGGILGYAPDLMAFYAPTVNSYRRTSSTGFAGCGASWGFDNRTVSCRVLGSSAESRRLEWRVPGADVNPYLAVAGLVASVRAGIAAGADPGKPVSANAYELPLPPFARHLGEAAERFLASELARAAFGEAVVEHYGLTARYEWSQFLEAVTDWELDRYFEHI